MAKLFAGNNLTDRLRIVPSPGRRPLYRFTLEDLDELAGYMAAEANHAKVKKLEKELRRLYSSPVKPEYAALLRSTVHPQYSSPGTRFFFKKSGLISRPKPGPVGTFSIPLRTSGGLPAAMASM